MTHCDQIAANLLCCRATAPGGPFTLLLLALRRYAPIADMALRDAVNLTRAIIVRAGRGKTKKNPIRSRSAR